VSIAFDSQFGRTYRVAYKDTIAQTNWIVLNDITASSSRTIVLDTNAVGRRQRFYMVAAN